MTPIPGYDYRLESKLGEGGFGEVWKALGPGGFPVAIKRIPLKSAAGVILRGGQSEINAVRIMQRIRHANLIATHAAFFLCEGECCEEPQRADTVATIMELADGSLQDELSAALDKGGGIPQPNLLEYLAEAAKALDFLHSQELTIGEKEGRYVQHLDVKPHNLLLVGNAVAVADFGLVQLLGRTVTTGPDAYTPGFAAPEVLRGQASRSSDQYSLAVSYCYLLTGEHPYQRRDGAAMSNVEASELGMLPVGQRGIVARALSADPRDRWSGCCEFVAELRRVVDVSQPWDGSSEGEIQSVRKYLGGLNAWDDGDFQQATVELSQAQLHQRAYAMAHKLSPIRREFDIEFLLIPPATTRDASGGVSVFPPEVSRKGPAHFYISKEPLSPVECASLTSVGPDAKSKAPAHDFSAIRAWLEVARENFGRRLRLPTPAEWRHAAQLGLITGSQELCAESGAPYRAIYDSLPPFSCDPLQNPRQRLDADCRWRVVLE